MHHLNLAGTRVVLGGGQAELGGGGQAGGSVSLGNGVGWNVAIRMCPNLGHMASLASKRDLLGLSA